MSWGKNRGRISVGSNAEHGITFRNIFQDFQRLVVTHVPLCNWLFQPKTFWDELFPAEQSRIVRLLVERVDVAQDHIAVRLRAEGLQTLVEQLRLMNGKARAA